MPGRGGYAMTLRNRIMATCPECGDLLEFHGDGGPGCHSRESVPFELAVDVTQNCRTEECVCGRAWKLRVMDPPRMTMIVEGVEGANHDE